MRNSILPFFFLLLSMAAFSQSDSRLPPHSRIIYFGDSETSFGYGGSGNYVQFQNFGYIAWVNALAPDVYMPKGAMLGVAGETTTQMVNRLGAINTLDAKFLAVMAGTNDPVNLIPPETTKANLRTIYDAGLAAGMKVIALTIMPRFAPAAFNATDEANRKAINDWIKAQRDVIVVDVETDVNDPRFFEDGLHNSPLGAYVVGSRVAAEINQRVAHCLDGSVSTAGLSVAANANPYLAGTGGTVNNASGAVATHWQLAGNLAGGAAVTGSKEVDASGKEKQVITLSGTYKGTYQMATLNNYAASPIALVSGDVVEGVAEIEVASALTNIKGIYLRVIAYNGDYSAILADGNSLFPTSVSPTYMPAGKYLLRTPPITIDPGTVGQLTTQVVLEFNSNGGATAIPVAATVRVSSAGIRRLPLPLGPLASVSPTGTVTACPGTPAVLTAGAGSGYAYQWQLNGNDLNGATAATYAATDPGSYTVKVGTEGCVVLSGPTVVVAGNCQQAGIATGSVATNLCMGQVVNVPFTATGTFHQGNVFTAQLSDGSGSFASPVSIGSVTATAGGTIVATIPSSLAQNTGYRIRVVSSNPALAGSNNGANIRINAVPALTSTLTPAAICNNKVFSYTPSSSVSGAAYSWSRAAVTGISNPAATGMGAIQETLQNTTAAPVNVSYVYSLSNNGCSASATYKVVVPVKPSPVARARNLAVNLDAAGRASITPQQVDNGSAGGCGTLQYSLDKTQFACANIGNNTVTLRVTDASGISSTATAVVSVADQLAPVISNATVSAPVLTPADQRIVTVTIGYNTQENCGTAVTSLSVKSNESQVGLFKNDKWPDWFVLSKNQVLLRAERSPFGQGRVYTITITARDARGNTSTKDVTVKVPNNQLQGLTTISGVQARAGAEESETPTTLRLTVLPNPSGSHFTLQISSGSKAPVTVRIMDAQGRVVDVKGNVPASGLLQLGQQYKPGQYLAEVLQGSQRVLQQLIKL